MPRRNRNAWRNDHEKQKRSADADLTPRPITTSTRRDRRRAQRAFDRGQQKKAA